MSTTITFDTLEYTEQLKAAGVPEEQAKGHAKALALVIKQFDARADEQATKHDKQVDERLDSLAEKSEKQVRSRLDGLATKQEMDYRLAALEANLRKDIETAKVETIKWVIVTGIAILGGVAAINRMFPPVPAYYQPPAQEMRQPAPPPAPMVPPAAPLPAQPAR
ncbi:MAG: CCDC90 family protein [Magnetococcus sp. YQC-3]